MYLEFMVADETYAVAVDQDGRDWTLTIEGQEVPLQAVLSPDGAWLVDTHQGRRRLFVAQRGDERLVFCDGKVHTLRRPDPEHEDDDGGDVGGPNLTAAMPGKIVQVLVSEGEAVAAGQRILIMESMKMETELLANMAGQVGKIHVGGGQLVGQGDPLVDIVPEG